MPSKALDISKKIPLTSRGRLQSWDAQMSCTIESSWYSQESKNLKPDWCSQRRSFSSRNSYTEVNIILNIRILPQIGRREKGLQLSIFWLSPFS